MEEEAHGGSQNDGVADAQSLDESFLDLGGGLRGAVRVVSGYCWWVQIRMPSSWKSISPRPATVIASGVNNGRGYTDLARNPVTGVLYGTGRGAIRASTSSIR